MTLSLPAPIRIERLGWFIAIRWIAVALSAGGGAALWILHPASLSGRFVVAGAALLALLNALHLLLLRRDLPRTELLGWLQILGDLALLTAFLFVTGGIRKPFVAFYLLHVILAGFLLSTRATVCVALLSAACVFLLESLPPLASVPWDAEDALPVSMSAAVLGGGAYLVMKFMDAERGAHRQVRSERQLLTDILDHLTEGVLYLDPEGSVLRCNPSARRSGGCTQCGTRSDAFRCFPGVDRTFLDPLLAEFRGGRRDSVRLEHEAGDRLYLSTFTPVRGEEHRLESVVWTIQDATERRNLERQVRHQEKIAALGRLAAGIAHEVRNPLASISGIVQMLRRRRAAPREDLELVDEQIGRINRIVRDVTAFARRSPEQKQRLELNRLVEDSLRVAALDRRWNGIRVDLQLAHPSPVVRANADQILQVFLNLLLNGADAMTGGGLLRIATAREGGRATARFADSGPGVPAELREHIFEPFFTTKPPGLGTGLGLSVSWNIVADHGGSIAVGDNPGGGAEFSVQLPLEETHAGTNPDRG